MQNSVSFYTLLREPFTGCRANFLARSGLQSAKNGRGHVVLLATLFPDSVRMSVHEGPKTRGASLSRKKLLFLRGLYFIGRAVGFLALSERKIPQCFLSKIRKKVGSLLKAKIYEDASPETARKESHWKTCNVVDGKLSYLLIAFPWTGKQNTALTTRRARKTVRRPKDFR